MYAMSNVFQWTGHYDRSCFAGTISVHDITTFTAINTINNRDFMSYQHLSDSWYSDLLFESLERVKNMAVYIFPVLIYNHNNSNSMVCTINNLSFISS